MKLYWLLAVAVTFTLAALADTEIRNFHLPLPFLNLSAQDPERTLRRDAPLSLDLSQIQELSIALDLKDFSAWTVRMSWPGSSPTKFSLEVGTMAPGSDNGILRVKASALSPTFPGVIPSSTPVHITLEPLVMGVIPHSILPTLGFLGIFGTVAGLLIRPAMSLLEAQVSKDKAA